MLHLLDSLIIISASDASCECINIHSGLFQRQMLVEALDYFLVRKAYLWVRLWILQSKFVAKLFISENAKKTKLWTWPRWLRNIESSTSINSFMLKARSGKCIHKMQNINKANLCSSFKLCRQLRLHFGWNACFAMENLVEMLALPCEVSRKLSDRRTSMNILCKLRGKKICWRR